MGGRAFSFRCLLVVSWCNVASWFLYIVACATFWGGAKVHYGTAMLSVASGLTLSSTFVFVQVAQHVVAYIACVRERSKLLRSERSRRVRTRAGRWCSAGWMLSEGALGRLPSCALASSVAHFRHIVSEKLRNGVAFASPGVPGVAKLCPALCMRSRVRMRSAACRHGRQCARFRVIKGWRVSRDCSIGRLDLGVRSLAHAG